MHAKTGKIRRSNFQTKALSAAGVKRIVVVPPSSADTATKVASFGKSLELVELSSSLVQGSLWSMADVNTLTVMDVSDSVIERVGAN